MYFTTDIADDYILSSIYNCYYVHYYFVIKDYIHVLNTMTSVNTFFLVYYWHVLNTMTFVTTFLSKTTNMSSTPWLPLLLSYQRLLTCLQCHDIRYFFLIKDYRHALNNMTSVAILPSKTTYMSSISWLSL